MSELCSRKGMADPQKTSAYPVWLSTVKVHMINRPITRIGADVHMLSRKVVRDSVRGISESWLGPRKMLMADDLYHHSKGGYSVCMVSSVLL